MVASITDLLRLVVIPVFTWLAWRDIQTRRIPNAVWKPLLIFAGMLLLWDGFRHLYLGSPHSSAFLLNVGLSLFVMVPAGYAMWLVGIVGAADAKAIITLSILIPFRPEYTIAGTVYPVFNHPFNVFSFSVVSNTLLLFMSIPVGIMLYNLVNGNIDRIQLLLKSRPVDVESLPHRHGVMHMSSDSISETEAETTLDLDVLRMYLRWRGITLASILSAPEAAQQPQRVGDTNDPTDGRSEVDDDLRWGEIEEIEDGDTDGQGDYNCTDRWAVDRFFDEVDRSVYRTSPEQLRSGLDFLTNSSRDSVWVSPGTPFFVPMYFGVILAFSHGNLIFELVRYSLS